MLWLVTVEAWDASGNGDYYESIVLAHSERGARSASTRAVARLGLTGAHSVEVKMLDIRETGVAVLIKRNGELLLAREVDHGW